MNQHQRTAFRFAAYIRALGGEPIPFHHGSHREWALDLQRQHDRMRQRIAPDQAKAAKTTARALIRRKGYRRAAAEATPVQMTVPSGGERAGDIGGVRGEADNPSDQSAPVLSAKERRALRAELRRCRRKLRHQNYMSAVLHAMRLGDDVQIYPCACGGLHVGHREENAHIRQYRRAQKRLQVIESRLGALEKERKALIRERSQIMRKLRNLGGSGDVLAEVTKRLHRLLSFLKPGPI